MYAYSGKLVWSTNDLQKWLKDHGVKYEEPSYGNDVMSPDHIKKEYVRLVQQAQESAEQNIALYKSKLDSMLKSYKKDAKHQKDLASVNIARITDLLNSQLDLVIAKGKLGKSEFQKALKNVQVEALKDEYATKEEWNRISSDLLDRWNSLEINEPTLLQQMKRSQEEFVNSASDRIQSFVDRVGSSLAKQQELSKDNIDLILARLRAQMSTITDWGKSEALSVPHEQTWLEKLQSELQARGEATNEQINNAITTVQNGYTGYKSAAQGYAQGYYEASQQYLNPFIKLASGNLAKSDKVSKDNLDKLNLSLQNVFKTFDWRKSVEPEKEQSYWEKFAEELGLIQPKQHDPTFTEQLNYILNNVKSTFDDYSAGIVAYWLASTHNFASQIGSATSAAADSYSSVAASAASAYSAAASSASSAYHGTGNQKNFQLSSNAQTSLEDIKSNLAAAQAWSQDQIDQVSNYLSEVYYGEKKERDVDSTMEAIRKYLVDAKTGTEASVQKAMVDVRKGLEAFHKKYLTKEELYADLNVNHGDTLHTRTNGRKAAYNVVVPETPPTSPKLQHLIPYHDKSAVVHNDKDDILSASSQSSNSTASSVALVSYGANSPEYPAFLDLGPSTLKDPASPVFTPGPMQDVSVEWPDNESTQPQVSQRSDFHGEVMKGSQTGNASVFGGFDSIMEAFSYQHRQSALLETTQPVTSSNQQHTASEVAPSDNSNRAQSRQPSSSPITPPQVQTPTPDTPLRPNIVERDAPTTPFNDIDFSALRLGAPSPQIILPEETPHDITNLQDFDVSSLSEQPQKRRLRERRDIQKHPYSLERLQYTAQMRRILPDAFTTLDNMSIEGTNSANGRHKRRKYSHNPQDNYEQGDDTASDPEYVEGGSLEDDMLDNMSNIDDLPAADDTGFIVDIRTKVPRSTHTPSRKEKDKENRAPRLKALFPQEDVEMRKAFHRVYGRKSKTDKSPFAKSERTAQSSQQASAFASPYNGDTLPLHDDSNDMLVDHESHSGDSIDTTRRISGVDLGTQRHMVIHSSDSEEDSSMPDDGDARRISRDGTVRQSKLAKLRAKKGALKGILPPTYLKVFNKEMSREERLRTQVTRKSPRPKNIRLNEHDELASPTENYFGRSIHNAENGTDVFTDEDEGSLAASESMPESQVFDAVESSRNPFAHKLHERPIYLSDEEEENAPRLVKSIAYDDQDRSEDLIDRMIVRSGPSKTTQRTESGNAYPWKPRRNGAITSSFRASRSHGGAASTKKNVKVRQHQRGTGRQNRSLTRDIIPSMSAESRGDASRRSWKFLDWATDALGLDLPRKPKKKMVKSRHRPPKSQSSILPFVAPSSRHREVRKVAEHALSADVPVQTVSDEDESDDNITAYSVADWDVHDANSDVNVLPAIDEEDHHDMGLSSATDFANHPNITDSLSNHMADTNQGIRQQNIHVRDVRLFLREHNAFPFMFPIVQHISRIEVDQLHFISGKFLADVANQVSGKTQTLIGPIGSFDEIGDVCYLLQDSLTRVHKISSCADAPETLSSIKDVERSWQSISRILSHVYATDHGRTLEPKLTERLCRDFVSPIVVQLAELESLKHADTTLRSNGDVCKSNMLLRLATYAMDWSLRLQHCFGVDLGHHLDLSKFAFGSICRQLVAHLVSRGTEALKPSIIAGDLSTYFSEWTFETWVCLRYFTTAAELVSPAATTVYTAGGDFWSLIVQTISVSYEIGSVTRRWALSEGYWELLHILLYIEQFPVPTQGNSQLNAKCDQDRLSQNVWDIANQLLSNSIFECQSQDWTDLTHIERLSLDCYTKALFARIHLLVSVEQISPNVDVVYRFLCRFFRERNYRDLEFDNTVFRGSSFPAFFQAYDGTLEEALGTQDSTFHILLRTINIILRITEQLMEDKEQKYLISVEAEKQLRRLIARLLPTHLITLNAANDNDDTESARMHTYTSLGNQYNIFLLFAHALPARFRMNALAQMDTLLKFTESDETSQRIYFEAFTLYGRIQQYREESIDGVMNCLNAKLHTIIDLFIRDETRRQWPLVPTIFHKTLETPHQGANIWRDQVAKELWQNTQSKRLELITSALQYRVMFLTAPDVAPSFYPPPDILDSCKYGTHDALSMAKYNPVIALVTLLNPTKSIPASLRIVAMDALKLFLKQRPAFARLPSTLATIEHSQPVAQSTQENSFDDSGFDDFDFNAIPFDRLEDSQERRALNQWNRDLAAVQILQSRFIPLLIDLSKTNDQAGFRYEEVYGMNDDLLARAMECLASGLSAAVDHQLLQWDQFFNPGNADPWKYETNRAHLRKVKLFLFDKIAAIENGVLERYETQYLRCFLSSCADEIITCQGTLFARMQARRLRLTGGLKSNSFERGSWRLTDAEFGDLRHYVVA
ncbi:hypothetical protein BZG36_03235, partial [Bifiguratus adelaidae]